MAASESVFDVNSIYLFVLDSPSMRDPLDTASLKLVLNHTILALLNEQRTSTLTSLFLMTDRARIRKSRHRSTCDARRTPTIQSFETRQGSNEFGSFENNRLRLLVLC